MTPVHESQRRSQLDRFYRTYRGQLIGRVLRRVGAIDFAQAEDACHTAWAILARRRDIDLDPRGLAWITRVAVHEGWRLTHAAASTVQPGAWDPEDVLALVAADTDDPLDRAIDREKHNERAANLAALKLAERQALALKAIGYSYAEIADLTGASYTAVNRRLTEGRARLRAAGNGPDSRGRGRGRASIPRT